MAAITLSSCLHPDQIAWHLPPAPKEKALLSTCSLLQAHPAIQDWNAVYDSILEREETHPTAFQNGLAIAHCRTNSANSLLIALSTSTEGFIYPNDEKIHFLFAIAVPNKAPADYLRIVGSIARIFSNPTQLASLLKLPDPNAFIQKVKILENQL